MSKSLRLSEKWFQRGLWLVAFAFASFLIGLGGKVVENLYDAVPVPSAESFMDPVEGPRVRAASDLAGRHLAAAKAELEQAALKHQAAQANTATASEKFQNWLATRRATALPEQDAELVTRTREIDTLKADERVALAAMEAQQQAQLDAIQAHNKAGSEWKRLYDTAEEAAGKAAKAAELKVFLYRLALTLPLLVVAAWLFARKRNSIYWPFVWGFIYFAGFAFFVELVPYLPSYGGYVRYGVGIAVTVVVGRYAILALQRYLERQKEAEALPEVQRRETLSYDLALTRLGKCVCPGCERQVDLKDTTLDYCPHCGIGLFDRCGHCTTRKSAFSRFCFSCGTPAKTALGEA